jgi:lysophospholipase L1-like esterase
MPGPWLFRPAYRSGPAQAILAPMKLRILSALCALLLLGAPPPARCDTDPKAFGSVLAQPIEDPAGRAMRSFYSALARTERREPSAVTRILHYGDSHVAADVMTGALRSTLQDRFGDAGPGFVHAGRPWSWYGRAGVVSGSTPRWRTENASRGKKSDGRRGISGVSLHTEAAGERVWLTAACSRFDIYLLAQPGGGSVDVRLDGKPCYGAVSLASRVYASSYLEICADHPGPHTIEVESVAPGPVRVLGFVAETEGPGVVYDALGVNGARADDALAWDWAIVASNLARRQPDLIVIGYGSNEVSDPDLDPDQYAEEFAELLRRLRRAAPAASLLVIAPPDRAVRVVGRWRPIRRMPALVAAQRRTALGSGAAFWDLYRAMGARGAIDRWARQPAALAQPDRVHLTRAGYRLVAAALYSELMRAYRRSRASAMLPANDER